MTVSCVCWSCRRCRLSPQCVAACRRAWLLLTSLPMQENGRLHSPASGTTAVSAATISDGATSSWRAISPDHLQQQQHAAVVEAPAAERQPSQQQGSGSAAMSPLRPATVHGSAGASPIKPHGLPHDETVVYSALARPLPDYALTHVFSQVGPGAISLVPGARCS